ncbi:glutaredoxin 3 [Rubrimonas cliftonensis]|uniref:Glutaredoxin n=1 Tax=Rubrimonas cliftonensis TaxID=89524 RepID=A0A1H4BW52_9RHOB|nr:glutaredoxin 3 [Rubrimonas cliftonensis]SEA52320.1 glutaredoxin 3 [Rubrimonas cliftonensis]
MKPVEIYTTPICGFCAMAKKLLRSKGVSFTEFDVMSDPAKRAEMTQRSGGGRTVPQIFIDGAPIGGCDELHALERAGRLDAMLAA